MNIDDLTDRQFQIAVAFAKATYSAIFPDKFDHVTDNARKAFVEYFHDGVLVAKEITDQK